MHFYQDLIGRRESVVRSVEVLCSKNKEIVHKALDVAKSKGGYIPSFFTDVEKINMILAMMHNEKYFFVKKLMYMFQPFDVEKGSAGTKFSPLMISIVRGDPTLIDFFLYHQKPDFSRKTTEGHTALSLAILLGDYDTALKIVRLSKLRRNKRHSETKKSSMFHLEISTKYNLLHLVAANISKNPQNLNSIDKAIKLSKELLKQKVKILDFNAYSYTVLHTAVLFNQPEYLRFLLTWGKKTEIQRGNSVFDIDAVVKKQYSYTPLGCCCLNANEYPSHTSKHSRAECARVLLEFGADVEISIGPSDYRPLSKCIKNSMDNSFNLEVAEVLVENGADLDHVTSDERNIITLSIRTLNIGFFKYILSFEEVRKSIEIPHGWCPRAFVYCCLKVSTIRSSDLKKARIFSQMMDILVDECGTSPEFTYGECFTNLNKVYGSLPGIYGIMMLPEHRKVNFRYAKTKLIELDSSIKEEQNGVHSLLSLSILLGEVPIFWSLIAKGFSVSALSRLSSCAASYKHHRLRQKKVDPDNRESRPFCNICLSSIGSPSPNERRYSGYVKYVEHPDYFQCLNLGCTFTCCTKCHYYQDSRNGNTCKEIALKSSSPTFTKLVCAAESEVGVFLQKEKKANLLPIFMDCGINNLDLLQKASAYLPSSLTEKLFSSTIKQR
eukprot:augustus_masked-scaffold_12-processed-gene-6.56-mRNA-1 protein AED:1.00 eAED:1.00 QI:0/-1/0/0/-1/1/1/0/665